MDTRFYLFLILHLALIELPQAFQQGDANGAAQCTTLPDQQYVPNCACPLKTYTHSREPAKFNSLQGNTISLFLSLRFPVKYEITKFVLFICPDSFYGYLNSNSCTMKRRVKLIHVDKGSNSIKVDVEVEKGFSCEACSIKWAVSGLGVSNFAPVPHTRSNFQCQNSTRIAIKDNDYGSLLPNDIGSGIGDSETTTLSTSKVVTVSPVRSSPIFTSPKSKILCWAVGAFARVHGSRNWCYNNCLRGHCPQSHCKCSYHTTTRRVTTTTEKPTKRAPDTPKGNCKGRGAYAVVPGIDEWCQRNCRLGYCPPTHCECISRAPSTIRPTTPKKPVCKSVGIWKTVPGMDLWCARNCERGYCPESHCKCTTGQRVNEGSPHVPLMLKTGFRGPSKRNASKSGLLTNPGKKLYTSTTAPRKSKYVDMGFKSIPLNVHNQKPSNKTSRKQGSRISNRFPTMQNTTTTPKAPTKPTTATKSSTVPTTATKSSTMPTTATKTSTMPTTATKSSTIPTTPTKSSTVPTKATKSSTIPTTATKSSTVPTTATKSSTVPTTATKSSTVPTTATKSSTVPTTATKTSTMPTKATKTSTMPTKTTKSSTVPTTTSKTFKMPVISREGSRFFNRKMCAATKPFRSVPGMDEWCRINCKGGYCPSSQCLCYPYHTIPRHCRPVPPYDKVPSMHEWCDSNCIRGNCPRSHCYCIT